MCRDTINVGWRGEVYDCDFNQMLNLQLAQNQHGGKPLFLWDVELCDFPKFEIQTGAHCFGCTAGSGSSCGGAIA